MMTRVTRTSIMEVPRLMERGRTCALLPFADGSQPAPQPLTPRWYRSGPVAGLIADCGERDGERRYRGAADLDGRVYLPTSPLGNE